MARLDNLNTSRPRTATKSGPSAQASWFPAISRSSWRAAPKSSAVAGSPPTRSPRHQRSSTPAAAMAPSTARSRSWRPSTAEQTPILTEHHSDLLHSKVGLSRLSERTGAVRGEPFGLPWCPMGVEPRISAHELRRFFDEDYRQILGAVTLVTGSRVVAEDAVNEAIARWWEKRDHVRQMNRWVLTVALNLVRNRW